MAEARLSRVASKPLVVRGRLGPESPGAPGPLALDLGREGPIARERLATRWSDTAALSALATAKRGPLAPELGAALTDYHRRLGASPASLASLDRLVRGEAVAAVAGQQPAPLGGPLYTLHKTAATRAAMPTVDAVLCRV